MDNSQQWRGGEFNPTYGAAAGTTEQAKPWPTPEEQAQNIAWTVRIPRPKTGDCADYLLTGRQEQWDAAEAQRQTHEAAVAEMRAERSSATEKAEAERVQVFQAAEAEKVKRTEDIARMTFIASGGTQAEWEVNRDRLMADLAAERAEQSRRRGGALISPAAMLR